jgi:hypothetical protein
MHTDGSGMRQTPLADQAGLFSILARIDAGLVPIHDLFIFFRRCGNGQSTT